MKYTIHRALAMAKITEKRLNEAIEELDTANALYDFKVGKSTKTMGGALIEDAKKDISSRYDKYVALLNNYINIKLAIVRSNGGITDDTTNVKEYDVCGRKCTLAEIIVLQNIVKYYEQLFVSRLNRIVTKAEADIHKKNLAVADKLTALLNTIGGSDKTKLNAADIDATTKSFMENNEVTLVDPLNIRKLYEQHSKALAEKLTEIDASISESNALTVVDIDM